tara:strand:- start:57 stop:314 length:258 start_codon:yes stop_codon:yes gene_type:complete
MIRKDRKTQTNTLGVKKDSPSNNQLRIGQAIKEAANARNLDPHEPITLEDICQAVTKTSPPGSPKTTVERKGRPSNSFQIIWAFI